MLSYQIKLQVLKELKGIEQIWFALTKSLKVNGEKKISVMDRFALGKIKLMKAYCQGKFINKILLHVQD